MTSLKVFHSNEDGTTVEKIVEIELNDDLHFRMKLPDYIVQAFDLHPFVAAENALAAGAAYEAIADRYSKHRLCMGSEVLLMLDVCTFPSHTGANLSINLMPVVTRTDEDGAIHAYESMSDGSIGPLCNMKYARLLPDTPEIRAKAEELIGSIRRANKIMQGFLQAEDPGAYLLEISNDWKESTPLPAEVTAQDDLFTADTGLADLPIDNTSDEF